MKKLYAFELSSQDDLLALIKQAVQEVLSDNHSSFNSLPPPNDIDVLTSKDVCNLLGISTPTLIKYRKSGRLRGKRVSGKYHYLKSDINNFLKK